MSGHRSAHRAYREAPQCVCCELREGILAIGRHIWSCYRSRQGGPPMLVLDLAKGQRIHIDGVAEVALLDVRDGQVTLAVQSASRTAHG